MDQRRVLVLQHAEPEHLGRFADALAAAGLSGTTLRPDLGQPLPDRLNGFQGLIVMGGPQSVYDEAHFPFLKEEKVLVRRALVSDLPIFGVCLGSQLLADVLEATVREGERLEVGWKDVTLSADVMNDPVLSCLPPTFTPLHWHGDIYDLPAGAKSVGSSAGTAVQGFIWNQRVYALLFHLEMTVDQVEAMAAMFPEDVRRGDTTMEKLLAEAPYRVEALRSYCLNVFGRWASLV